MALRTNLAEWASTPFESTAHQIEAQKDPQYRNIPEYRDAVYAKIARGAGGIAPRVYNDSRTVEVVGGGIGSRQSEAGKQLTGELVDVDTEMVAQYGRQSIAPAPVVRPKESAKPISQWTYGATVAVHPDQR